MKIVFFELAKKDQALFAGALGDAEISFFEERLDTNNIEEAKDADVLCIFTRSLVDKDVIDSLPDLKFIATLTTGFDHIDVPYANEKGIKVSNVPAYGSETVAEFAFALLLALSRKIREADRAIRENGDFSKPAFLEGFDLTGKTFGVVGTGKIGRNAIKIARGFSMKVVACDPHPDLGFAENTGFEYKDFTEVIKEADIISLHAPYTKENHHMINRESVSLMKRGAYVINTARGELVDNDALLEALKSGAVGGAGLDVLEGEKGFKKGDTIPLLGEANVIITPHIAFDTTEARSRIMQTTIDNIKAFISGDPANLVK